MEFSGLAGHGQLSAVLCMYDWLGAHLFTIILLKGLSGIRSLKL